MGTKQRAPSNIQCNEFNDVFRQLPERKMLICAKDLEYVIEDVTDSYCRMIGVDRDDIIGKPYFTVFPNSSHGSISKKSSLSKAFLRVVHESKPQIQHVFRHDIPDPINNEKMVERYWQITLYPILSKDERVAHILQVSSNETTAVISNRELEMARHHLEDAMEAGKVASWTWKIGSDFIKSNSGLAALFGLPENIEATGLRPDEFLQLIHKNDRDRVRSALLRTIESGENFNSEFRVGKSKWMLGRARLLIKNGEKSLSGITVDVTEQRDLKAKINLAKRQDRLNREEAKLLQKRNEELEIINKTKEEFVALASHQLRTPATAVKQYLGMVLQGYAGSISDMQTDMLQKAFDSNERQIQIINQILNTARADTGRLIMTLAPIDIVTLVKIIVEDLRSTIEGHQHTLFVELPKTKIIMNVDSGYIRMALENLINNADKYTPENGSIKVSLKNLQTKVLINVEDSGVGIAKIDIDKLFIKFSRIHNPLSIRAGGSGIGLYLAGEIVRLHDGVVNVSSKLGKGTIFSMELPKTELNTKNAR